MCCLNGKNPLPELQHDVPGLELNPDLPRLEIDSTSQLYQQLCAPDSNGTCTYPVKVILSSNLEIIGRLNYEELDTLQTVIVQSGSKRIFYEYLHPPCVDQLYFNNVKKVFTGKMFSSVKTMQQALCADP
eukprot:8555377-Ditylum_brightwellii.AAC.1